MKATTAIAQRLFWYLGLSLPILWLTTAAFSAVAVLHEINEAGDSQMSQLARQLLHVPVPDGATTILPELKLPKAQRGQADDDEMGFALWRADGTLLLADESGSQLPYRAEYQGFDNLGHWWRSKSWRVIYLRNPDYGTSVAVAARWKERLETVGNALLIQIILSLLALPLMLWLLVWAVRRGMQPLHQLADELHRRDADSLQAVSTDVPAEAAPMVNALNQLLQRMQAALAREQRFTADAAHELRSPLAALKVQTEVLALTHEPDEQQQRLAAIRHGIDRAGHLVDQLLTLSRLDPLKAPPYTAAVSWQRISEQALQSVNLAAREQHIRLQRHLCADSWADVLPCSGDEMLLGLLLRNLLDNAVRYSPAHSQVQLYLHPDYIDICDHGGGVAAADLHRIRERFFRPPGQSQTGSGLGLSIADTIARLHGLSIDLDNLPASENTPAGLRARIRMNTAA